MRLYALSLLINFTARESIILMIFAGVLFVLHGAVLEWPYVQFPPPRIPPVYLSFLLKSTAAGLPGNDSNCSLGSSKLLPLKLGSTLNSLRVSVGLSHRNHCRLTKKNNTIYVEECERLGTFGGHQSSRLLRNQVMRTAPQGLPNFLVGWVLWLLLVHYTPTKTKEYAWHWEKTRKHSEPQATGHKCGFLWPGKTFETKCEQLSLDSKRWYQIMLY